MKKRIIGLSLALVLVLMVMASPVLAYDGQVELFTKDAQTWEVVEGASGTLDYNTSSPTFDYNLSATGLEDTNYSLIYYADPWPGNNPGALLGTFEASGGAIDSAQSIDLGMSLPIAPDANVDDGAKVWLVPSDCYDDLQLRISQWQPSRFLFENNLITYQKVEPIPTPVPQSESVWWEAPNLFLLRIGNSMTQEYTLVANALPAIEQTGVSDGHTLKVVILEGTLAKKGTDKANYLSVSDIGGTLKFGTRTSTTVTFSNSVTVFEEQAGTWVQLAQFTQLVNGSIPQ